MSTSDNTAKKNFQVATFAVIGIVVFILHILVFYFNHYAFNIMISAYVLSYAVMMIIIITKNTDCFSKSIFNVTINLSLYTIVLQVSLIIFTIIMMARKKT